MTGSAQGAGERQHIAIPARISVCIATHKRVERLAALLDDLSRQTRVPDEVVIVDNDADGSALAMLAAKHDWPFALRSELQPVKNISITRNRSVALAGGDWLAFVDDDERAPSQWIEQLVDAARRYHADAVLGPVEPVLPADAPDWIRRGRFYDWARMRSGTPVPPNRLRLGNLLIRASLLKAQSPPFDPAYGLTGGEDGDLLARLSQQGAHIVWCDEAVVREPIEASRLSLRWLLRRALRGGQDFARHTVAGRYGDGGWRERATLFARALIQAGLAAGLALLCWPLGRHHAVFWLTRLSANLGKLSVFWGAHYREYA